MHNAQSILKATLLTIFHYKQETWFKIAHYTSYRYSKQNAKLMNFGNTHKRIADLCHLEESFKETGFSPLAVAFSVEAPLRPLDLTIAWARPFQVVALES